MQRHIELVIGRLLTDQGFRRAFKRDPLRVLVDGRRWGLDLSPAEVAALLATDPSLWERMSVEIDRRLHNTGLSTAS